MNSKTTSKSFGYKTKIIGNTPATNKTLETEVFVPLIYLHTFWRSLDMHLINCEIEVDLLWLKDSIVSDISRTAEVPANPCANPPTNRISPTQTTRAIFQINIVKLCVPVNILSINDDIKFLENVKQGSKKSISWNKYRSEITTQPKSNNPNCMIHSAFRNIDKLFVFFHSN